MNLQNFEDFMANNFATVENGMKAQDAGIDIQQFEQPYLSCIEMLAHEYFGEEKWGKMNDFIFDYENNPFKTLEELHKGIFPNENKEVRQSDKPE